MFKPAISVLLTAAVAVPAIAAELRDPTEPPVVHQSAVRRLEITQPTHYTLSAIKISGAERKALINGQLIAEGEQIGEARLLEVAADAVVIEYLSEQRRIALLPEHVRRTATGR